MATEREPDAPARRTKAETLRQIGDRLRQVNGDGPCNPPDLVLALDLLIDAHNETLRECETLRAAVAYRPGLPSSKQVRAHEARGGWWQFLYEGDEGPCMVKLRWEDHDGDASLIVGRHAGRIEFSRVSPPSSCRPVTFPDGTPCPWLDAPLDPAAAADNATGGCPGMNAALRANSAPALTTTARPRCCQFHELGGDERHGCGGDATRPSGPRPRLAVQESEAAEAQGRAPGPSTPPPAAINRPPGVVAAGVSATPLARLKSIATQIIRQIDLLAMPLCADQQEGMSRATRTLVATLIAEMEADGEVPAASARQVERRAVVILADLQRGAAPTPGREAKMDHHIEREDNATGGCRPGGPYCPGMNAALDAAAKGGLAAGSLLKIGGAAEPPEVIIHRGVINGERRQLLLQCCPFCRAELEPRRTLVAAAPAAEGTLALREVAAAPTPSTEDE